MIKCRADISHNQFVAIAIERHEWVVDGNGEFMEDLGSYDSELVEVFECATCGSESFKEN